MSWTRRWKKTKAKFNWRQIERACKQTIDQYDGKHITRVIGLSRGGLIPATIVANHIGARYVYSVGLASYELTDNGMEFTGDHDVYQRIPVNCPGFSKRDHVLIVDDISDKGATFDYVIRTQMPSLPCSYTTMSIFIKPGTSHVPDLYHKQIDRELWVVFPWE